MIYTKDIEDNMRKTWRDSCSAKAQKPIFKGLRAIIPAGIPTSFLSVVHYGVAAILYFEKVIYGEI